MKDITIVLRSVGERTEELSLKKLKKNFGAENVFLVKDFSPFSRAVEETFKIGLQQNKKWTFAIDADVFLDDDKIKLFIKQADILQKKEPDLFCFEGKLFDNLFQTYRTVGAHLFHTKHLQKGLKFIEAGKNEKRPESYIKRKMHDRGYPFYTTNLTIGIHDFFQFYQSIVMKAILHSYKHDIKTFLPLWHQLSETSLDFKYALIGNEIFNKNKNLKILVDKNFINTLILHENLIFEKQEELTLQVVNEMLLAKRTIETDIKINKFRSIERKKIKLFKKVKNSNGRRDIYFCGIKIFSS